MAELPPSEELPDRPLQCSNCRRPITTVYTEVVGEELSRVSMCALCPVLQERLHGEAALAEAGGKEPKSMGLICGQCETTLEAIRTGNFTGCPVCYEIFSDLIAYELTSSLHLSTSLGQVEGKKAPLHIGRRPGEEGVMGTKIRLVALDEALQAALKGEDYEGAAWLRDQIAQAEAEAKDEKNR